MALLQVLLESRRFIWQEDTVQVTRTWPRQCATTKTTTCRQWTKEKFRIDKSICNSIYSPYCFIEKKMNWLKIYSSCWTSMPLSFGKWNVPSFLTWKFMERKWLENRLIVWQQIRLYQYLTKKNIEYTIRYIPKPTSYTAVDDMGHEVTHGKNWHS